MRGYTLKSEYIYKFRTIEFRTIELSNPRRRPFRIPCKNSNISAWARPTDSDLWSGGLSRAGSQAQHLFFSTHNLYLDHERAVNRINLQLELDLDRTIKMCNNNEIIT